jgi:hypothetical protein
VRCITFSIIAIMNVVFVTYLLIYIFLAHDRINFFVSWCIMAGALILSIPFCYISYKFVRFAAILVGIASGTALAFVL